MDRDKLIKQVKAEYAYLADIESKESFTDTTNRVTPEAYYERLLGEVLDGITAGKFDRFSSGKEIVEAVANDKERWGLSNLLREIPFE